MKTKKVLALMLTLALVLSNFSGFVFAATDFGLTQENSTENSISFKWGNVDSAVSYEYTVDGGTAVNVENNKNAFVGSLADGSSYSINVIAIGEREETTTEDVIHDAYRRWEGNNRNSRYHYYYYLNGNRVEAPASSSNHDFVYYGWDGRHDWYKGTITLSETTTTTVEYPITNQTVDMTTKKMISVPLNVGEGGVAVVNGEEKKPGSHIISAVEGSTITGNAYSNAGYAISSASSISYPVPTSPTAIEVTFTPVGDTHSQSTYETNGNFSGYDFNGADIAGHDPRGDSLSATMTATTAASYSLGDTAIISLAIDVTDGDGDGDGSTETLNEVDIYDNLGAKVDHGSVTDGTITKTVAIPSTVAELTDYSLSLGSLFDTYTKGVSFELVDRYNTNGGAALLATASTNIVVQVTAQHSLTWDNATASPATSQGEQDARAEGSIVFTANPPSATQDPVTLSWTVNGTPVSANSDETYTLVGLTANTHVVATYANKKLVSAKSDDTEMGTVSPDSAYLGKGQSTTFTASVNDSAYYRFAGWVDATGRTIGTESALTINADEYEDGALVTAIFEQHAVDVVFTTSIYNAVDTSTKVTTGTLGYVDFKLDNGTSFTQNGTDGTRIETAVPLGTVVTIEGIPYDSYNYRSAAFKANGANPRTVTISLSKTSVLPSAIFAEKGSYVVSATYDANHVEFDKEGTLKDDETRMFKATPDDHTVITSASYMYADTTESIPMNANSDGTFSAELGNLESDVHFTIVSETTYNVSAVSVNNDFGTVSPADKDYVEGELATVSASAKPEYSFVSWTVQEDDIARIVSRNANYSFTVTEDVLLTANFVDYRLLLTDLYAVRVNSNLPAGATFSGTGTGFSDGETYNVALLSYDDLNYTFLGFESTSNGTIAGADVTLNALFEEVVLQEQDFEDEEITEDLQEEPKDEPKEPVIEEPVIKEPEEETLIEEPEKEFLDEDVAEEVPAALPETGGVSGSLFTGFGAMLAGLGTLLRKKK